jgi:putative transposase
MYNWALTEINNDNPKVKVKEGEEKPKFVYDRYALQKKMTAYKNTIPYMKEVCSYAIVNCPSDNLHDGLQRCKVGLNKFPKFHNKAQGESFRLDGALIKYDKLKRAVKLPTPRGTKDLGWIAMAEPIRFKFTKINNIVISRKANMWYCSFNLDGIPDAKLCDDLTKEVGIDLGRSENNLIVCSDGRVIANHSVGKRDEICQRARNKRRSRREIKGKHQSKNWWKTHRLCQKAENHVAGLRAEYMHYMTNMICKRYGTVCLEDLNVKGMMSNPKSAKNQADVAFGEIRRQLTYKASKVKLIPTFEPSTNRCSVCGTKKVGNEKIGLGERTFTCNICGHIEDRDLNAAKCILKYAVEPENKVKKIGKKHMPKTKMGVAA